MQNDSVAREALQGVPKGVNDLLDPAFLPEGQAARLLNVEVRNGLAESRPGFLAVDCPAQGRFQGAFRYELDGALRWVLVVAGEVWTYNFATNGWLKIAEFPTKDFAQAWFCQAGKYAVVQNGVYDPVENWPIIFHEDAVVDNLSLEYIWGNEVLKVSDFKYDGESNLSRDADAIRVPIGKAMAFGQGRLFVAVERYYDNGLSSGFVGWRYDGCRHIVAGDDERWDDPSRMLVFRQNDDLLGGGALTVPAENGLITSLAFFRNASTGTGLGELLVMCRRGSSVYSVSVKRGGEDNQWGLAGFGQVLFQTSGSSSPWAVDAVNADLVYRGDGGLRTIKFTASGESGSGGLAVFPLSPEVSTLVGRTSPAHEPFVSLASAGNYVVFTSGGQELPTGDVAFRDALPWDLATFQASGEAPSRTFAGAWRGPLFHAVLKAGAGVLGAVVRQSAAAPLKLGIFDRAFFDPAQVAAVRTGAFSFKAPLMLKRVKYADLMFDRVRTDLEVKVRWRADGGPWWESDPKRFKSTKDNQTGPFRVAVEADNAGTGYFLEFAVVWTGHARLRTAVFSASRGDAFTGGEDAACATTDLDLNPRESASSAPEE